MIVANLATYPPRREHMMRVVEAMAPQVDQLNVVLNEYDSLPEELAVFESINPIIPPEDLKDTGKFYPDVQGADYVFLIDDDINYPPDYVKSSILALEEIDGSSAVGGYHASVYYFPKRFWSLRGLKHIFSFRPSRIAEYRRVHHFSASFFYHMVVDQLGTGTVVMRKNQYPSFDYMKGSQKFADVRFARWCFENGSHQVCLKRSKHWLSEQKVEESIYNNFTINNPSHVAREIWKFVFK